MKRLVVLGIALMLAGCQSAEEKKAEWISYCVQGEFSARQCDVLYSLKKSSDDAGDSAATAGMMSGMAAGVGAGRR